MRSLFISAAMIAVQAAADTIILPPVTEEGTDIAIVWIHGMDCQNTAYVPLAQVVQQTASSLKGQRVWVGLPQFVLDAPEPVLIDYYVEETLVKLRSQGFTGDNVVMAGHSLGGVMSQKYSLKKSDKVKAQVLMGSTLTREHRSIQADGTTWFDYPVPTLTIGGTKDGMMRISRIAEAFWHSSENINEEQQDLFPVVALDGVSHMQFMSGEPPKAVKKRDLKPDISEENAHQQVAATIVDFIDQVVNSAEPTIDTGLSKLILQPLLNAMEMESYYQMKEPCYEKPLINPKDDPTCLGGAPWNELYSQRIMGGTLPGKNSVLNNIDNFHRVYAVKPVHLSEIETDCDKSDTPCVMNTITVSQNHYDLFDRFDTGFYPQAASEMKVKLSSRQKVQVHGGAKFADFHEEDEVGNRCAEINDFSIQWAYNQLSVEAKANYESFGVKLVTGDDLGPFNSGPMWIWHFMDYTESTDGTQMIVSSPMMRTPTDYFVQSAAGFHYCKVLSPFRALEWMMTDALFKNNGIQDSAPLFFLQ